MQVGVVGINHKSSPLEIREKLTRVFDEEFGVENPFPGGVLLSTCNRTELYFCTPSLADSHMEILLCLRKKMEKSFEHFLYSYFGRDCFYHLGRVISGIDSAIFGESDIQRQAKLSYENFRKKGALPHELHYLFQKGLKIGKEMRTSFLLSGKESSLPFAIQSLIEWNHLDLKKSRFLLIGNSSINRKLTSYFKYHGVKSLTLCSRKKGVLLVDWKVLDHWDDYDVVICATRHTDYLIKNVQEKVSKTLLFDLSVPRLIDPSLGKHPRLKLYNIDQIGEIARKKKGEEEIHLCETVIENAVRRQMNLFNERQKAKWRYATAL